MSVVAPHASLLIQGPGRVLKIDVPPQARSPVSLWVDVLQYRTVEENENSTALRKT